MFSYRIIEDFSLGKDRIICQFMTVFNHNRLRKYVGVILMKYCWACLWYHGWQVCGEIQKYSNISENNQTCQNNLFWCVVFRWNVFSVHCFDFSNVFGNRVYTWRSQVLFQFTQEMTFVRKWEEHSSFPPRKGSEQVGVLGVLSF